MDTFAPEFAHYWLDGQAGDADVTNGEFGALDTPTQQAALIELGRNGQRRAPRGLVVSKPAAFGPAAVERQAA